MFRSNPNRRRPALARGAICWTAVCLLLFAAGCEQDMADQPRYEALEQSSYFPDGAASQRAPEGTVARGHLNADEHFFSGRVDGQLATTFPRPLDEAALKRGRERFNIFCAPCHDQTGSGHGIVVQRGFPKPPSFHTDRLREAPVGHFYDVISHGFGRMYDYSAQVAPEDRWAIAAYIRALQLSQHAPADRLSEADLQELNSQSNP